MLKNRLTLYLNEELHQALKRLAIDKQLSVNALVRLALQKMVKTESKSNN